MAIRRNLGNAIASVWLPQVLNVSVLRRQVQQRLQEGEFRVYLLVGHSVYPPEVVRAVFYGELSYESDVLRHVTDSRTGNATFLRARPPTEDEHFTGIELPPADNAGEESGLPAAARTQKTVSATSGKNVMKGVGRVRIPAGGTMTCSNSAKSLYKYIT